MGLTDKIGIAILCAFVLFSVVRLFAAPLRLAAKVLLTRRWASLRCSCSA